MSGRKPTIINLVATSPEGEVNNFYTLTDAANELGFHMSTLKRVHDAHRNWIGDYKLEWLNVSDKLEKEAMEEITKEREKAKEKKDKEKKYRTMAEKVKKEKVERDERRDAKLKARGKLVVKEVKISTPIVEETYAKKIRWITLLCPKWIRKENPCQIRIIKA